MKQEPARLNARLSGVVLALAEEGDVRFRSEKVSVQMLCWHTEVLFDPLSIF